eukprot:6860854-Prymnesium_polylepis.1
MLPVVSPVPDHTTCSGCCRARAQTHCRRCIDHRMHESHRKGSPSFAVVGRCRALSTSVACH